MPISLTKLNSLSEQEFENIIGPCFEHSPWISSSVSKKRPFKSKKDLFEALTLEIKNSSSEKKLDLIRKHPDLVSTKILTKHSQNEQDSIGLGSLPLEIKEEFSQLNRKYQEKFGFPFIVCVKDVNSAMGILEQFRERVEHDEIEQEMRIALQNIFRIGWWRLKDTILPNHSTL